MVPILCNEIRAGSGFRDYFGVTIYFMVAVYCRVATFVISGHILVLLLVTTCNKTTMSVVLNQLVSYGREQCACV